MKICIVEAEATDRQFFEQELAEYELHFADALAEVDMKPDIVSVFIHARVDASFLDNNPQLKLIATRSTTFDHIALDECARRRITVCCVMSYGDYTVAEHTFALILAVARRLRESRANRGQNFSYESTRGMELHGKTLGVVGAGRVGRKTIAIAKAFGMEVLANDIVEDAAAAQLLGFRYVALPELLREAHVISLHAPLTDENYHLLNRDAFAQCRRGVLIVNTARGRLIDTAALLEALDNGVVGGAGLDVLGEEKVMREKATSIISDQIAKRVREGEDSQVPDKTRVQQLEKLISLEDLLSRPNVIFTPHAAFNTNEAVERINRATVENIQAFAAGKPVNVVRFEAGGGA